MISIAAGMDEFDIVQEIRFERQVHKGSFLLLEGPEDLLRFTRFTDEKLCSTVNCFGRSNLINAIKLLYEDGFAGALGLADADFDRLTGQIEVHEGLIYSDTHDFDLDWVCQRTLHRYLQEVGDPGKCVAAGNAPGVIVLLLAATKPLSVLRYVNHHQNLRYRLSGVRHIEIVDNGVVEVDLLVKHVSQGAFGSKQNKQRLKQLIQGHLNSPYDPLQLTNGHDFLAMLGIALRDKLGKRLLPQTWQSEVQIHFRLAYSEEDFMRSGVFKAIVKWQENNTPYIILKSHLTSQLVNDC
jgi:hypothetical protein